MKINAPIPILNLLLSVAVVLLSTSVLAQNPVSGIIIGGNAGTSKMITEVSSDFKQHYTEFDQKSGFAGDLEIAKLLYNHFEVGTSFGISHLGGTLKDPSGSNNKYKLQGNQFFIRDLESPLEYNNRLIQNKFFVGYYFRSFSNISETMKPEPFVRLGAGYISYGVELFQNGQSTSGKGTENYPDLSMSSTIFFATAGVKSYISPNFFMNITFTCNYTNYDYLDAVFNFDTNEQRLGFGGLYSELKIGLFYQSSGKRKRGRSSKSNLAPNLPFSR
ncbi:hypothetical protein [Maribellus mangrovi]|uniref:hypothetical protein n=1 Tax=Maribellus mangrovi TaxID=3133146 RepID=UPI0030ECDD2B